MCLCVVVCFFESVPPQVCLFLERFFLNHEDQAGVKSSPIRFDLFGSDQPGPKSSELMTPNKPTGKKKKMATSGLMTIKLEIALNLYFILTTQTTL